MSWKVNIGNNREVTYAENSENEDNWRAGGVSCDVQDCIGRICVGGCGEGFPVEFDQTIESLIFR